jgi:hypothetical protein
MTQHQFLRNARMMFPNHVTQHNSFEDSVKILKNRGLLNEGNAVKGTPDKAPSYDYPTQPGKYKKVIQEPEVDEQDGIYPATTVTDIPKEEVSKPIKSKNRPDGLEPIKDKDTKNEMKKIRIVKESKKNLTENQKDIATPDVESIKKMMLQNSNLISKLKAINNTTELQDLADEIFKRLDPKLLQNISGARTAITNALKSASEETKGKQTFRPGVNLGKSSEKFFNQFRSPGASGPGQSLNKLKEAIKKMVNELLDEIDPAGIQAAGNPEEEAEMKASLIKKEYEMGDESNEAPSAKSAVGQIVDKMIDSLEDEKSFKQSDLEDVFSDFESNMGKRYSDDVFNDVIVQLKEKGYNLK